MKNSEKVVERAMNRRYRIVCSDQLALNTMLKLQAVCKKMNFQNAQHL